MSIHLPALECFFIKGSRLQARLRSKQAFAVGELGFGAGYHFLATLHAFLKYAPQTARLQYLAFEAKPLSRDVLTKIHSRWPKAYQSQAFLSHYPKKPQGIHHIQLESGRVQLTLFVGEALAHLKALSHAYLPQTIDAWYLSSFSSKHNVDACSLEFLEQMAFLSGKGTSIASYSVDASVKSALALLGFEFEKHSREGHGLFTRVLAVSLRSFSFSRSLDPADKPRDVRGSKDVRGRFTPWYDWPRQCFDKRAIIVGAGLAGCYLSHCLAIEGFEVHLIDEQASVAQRASANPQAVLFPSFSSLATDSYHQLLKIAAPFSAQVLQHWIKKGVRGEQKGVLEVGKHGQIHEDGGWIELPAWCHALIAHPNIHTHFNRAVSEYRYNGGEWAVNELSAPYLILAAGAGTRHFKAGRGLNLQLAKGQLTWVGANEKSRAQIRQPWCALGQGHLMPAKDEMHLIGATFDRTLTAGEEAKNDVINLERLKTLAPDFPWQQTSMGHWSEVRATTRNHMPCVGAAVDEVAFRRVYAALKTDLKRWIDAPCPVYPGCFIFTGFGARGVTTIPLLAHWLINQLQGRVNTLPRALCQALSPARFLIGDTS